MYLARKSTRFSEFADYYLSRNPIKTCMFEAYTEPNHTFYEDLKLTDDIIILRKEDVEMRLGISLEGLQQIEI